MTTRWTPWCVETLERMCKAGESASYIATIVGFSRNAVIGKAQRLGLRLHGRRKSHLVTVEEVSASMPAPPVPFFPATKKRSKDIPLMSLRNDTCRWPTEGEGLTQEFCMAKGADLADRRPYCPEHTRMATAVGRR